MPRLKRQARRRRMSLDELGINDLLTLGFGNWRPADHPRGMVNRGVRWLTLEAMEADWRMVRDEYLTRRPLLKGTERAWAELVFDEGMSPEDAQVALREERTR